MRLPKSSKTLYVCIVLVAIIGILGGFGTKALRRQALKGDCLSQLRAIGFSISLYSDQYNGALPESLQLLLNSHIVSNPRELLLCPSRLYNSRREASASDMSDYSYVLWPDQRGRGTNYAIYDRRLSNHGGLGVCVLVSTYESIGSRSNNLFWDASASWLYRFSHEHPQVIVKLPE